MPGPGQLTLADREELTLGVRGGESFAVIAARLGKVTSTVSREVAANGGRVQYHQPAPHDPRLHDTIRKLAELLAHTG